MLLFLYVPLKALFPNVLGIDPIHQKVTSQHARTVQDRSLKRPYSAEVANDSWPGFNLL